MKIVLFFDEVNTNDNINGLIKEIIVDRCLLGEEIDNRIIPIAACNPYISKGLAEMKTAGLEIENAK